MPRAISSDMVAALAAPILRPVLFVSIAFVSETAYLWSGTGSVSWNSHTWTGAGSLMSVANIEDAAQVEAKGIQISLSGFDASLLSEATTDYQLGLPANVYLGLYDDTFTLIADPLVCWSGRTDQPSFQVGGTDASITINCETELVDMNVAVDRRYTNEDIQRDNPGDLGCMFVNGIQEMTIFFGTPVRDNNI